jgi:hypothetical protein
MRYIIDEKEYLVASNGKIMCKVTTREAFLRTCQQYLPKESKCVEIGVLDGDFSAQILDVLKPAELILIDPFITNEDLNYGAEFQYLPTVYSTEKQYENVLNRFRDEIFSGKITVYRQYSYQATCRFPNEYFDFIYIDASHLYEDVKRDLDDWLPKLKQNGLICGHDMVPSSTFGVVKAVSEFYKEHNFELIIFNENGGDFALKRKWVTKHIR